jgi:hypothetical protein
MRETSVLVSAVRREMCVEKDLVVVLVVEAI